MQHGESLPPTNPSLKNGRLVYCLPKTCSNATFLAVQGGSIFVSSKTVYCRKLLHRLGLVDQTSRFVVFVAYFRLTC